MDILGIQLLGIIFSIALLYFVFVNQKKNEFNGSETVFWSIVSIGILIASAFPNLLNFIVNDVMNMSRTLDFLIIIGFLIMIGAVLYIFILVKETHNKVEKLVREIAIRDAEERKSKKRK